jgi:HAMP domain-containing protein
MTLLTVIVLAVVVALVLAYAVSSLRRVIEEDGAHDPRRTPPRSHYSDPFDPRSRLA